MSNREPLATTRTNENVPKHKNIFDDLIKHSKEGKMKQRVGDGVGDKVHRSAPVRTRPEIGSRHDEEMDQKLKELQVELDKANARIQRRDETIAMMKQQAANLKHDSGAAKTLEGKLEELVKKYQASKETHQIELSEVHDARALDGKRIEELKRAHLEAEREIWSLKQLEEEQTRGAASADELQRSLRRDLTAARVERDVAEERAAALEEQLAESTALCAFLAQNSVSADEFEVKQEAFVLEREETGILRTRLEVVEDILREERANTGDWESRYALAMEERDELAETLETLLTERACDRTQVDSAAPLEDPLPQLESDKESYAAITDLALTHSHLLSAHYNGELNHFDGCITTLLSSLLSAEDALQTAQESHDSLAHSHSALQSLHDTVVAQHAPCEGLISGLQTSVTRAEASEGVQKAALFEARREIEAMEDRVREAKDGVRRANEAVGRSKAAEGALVDEIEELREALASASGYQSLYEDLRSEHELLLSREEVMLDEVERVGAQNAELLGPTNGGQKLNYIDGLRREVAMVKHELATTRHRLNAAQDRVSTLTSEVEAYKSIDSPIGGSVLGGSTRTKVRRVPEGTAIPGRTLVSRRSQGMLRSASGPVR